MENTTDLVNRPKLMEFLRTATKKNKASLLVKFDSNSSDDEKPGQTEGSQSTKKANTSKQNVQKPSKSKRYPKEILQEMLSKVCFQVGETVLEEWIEKYCPGLLYLSVFGLNIFQYSSKRKYY